MKTKLIKTGSTTQSINSSVNNTSTTFKTHDSMVSAAYYPISISTFAVFPQIYIKGIEFNANHKAR